MERWSVMAVSDHPRIRGEHCWLRVPLSFHFGSSPHTRGALRRPQDRDRGRRIIPAYAGSTPSPRSSKAHSWDHPRIRGEHPPRRFAVRRRRGSSPHTRGARCRAANPGPDPGIIPAYAGSTPTPTWSKSRYWDHPRIRGEHCYDCCTLVHDAGSSPHTRGARRYEPPAGRAGRIIPAYAGSTPR